MRRLIVIGSLVAGMAAVLADASAPAALAAPTVQADRTDRSAAAKRSHSIRIRVRVTSVNGTTILLTEMLSACTLDRASYSCSPYSIKHLTTSRHVKIVRIANNGGVGFSFWADQRFRVRVFARGNRLFDRWAVARTEQVPVVTGVQNGQLPPQMQTQTVWVTGFMFFGNGVVVYVLPGARPVQVVHLPTA